MAWRFIKKKILFYDIIQKWLQNATFPSKINLEYVFLIKKSLKLRILRYFYSKMVRKYVFSFKNVLKLRVFDQKIAKTTCFTMFLCYDAADNPLSNAAGLRVFFRKNVNHDDIICIML